MKTGEVRRRLRLCRVKFLGKSKRGGTEAGERVGETGDVVEMSFSGGSVTADADVKK
jgi:hypothetical protein